MVEKDQVRLDDVGIGQDDVERSEEHDPEVACPDVSVEDPKQVRQDDLMIEAWRRGHRRKC